MNTNNDLLIRELKAELGCCNVKINRLVNIIEFYKNKTEKLEKENKELREENETLAEQITKIYTEESTEDDVRKAHNNGYGTAIGKMIAFLAKIKFDPIAHTEQDSNTFQKSILKDYGNYDFKVYGFAKNGIINKKLNIIKALEDVYNAPRIEIKSYVESLPTDKYEVTLLNHVSESTCKKLVDILTKVDVACEYFDI